MKELLRRPADPRALAGFVARVPLGLIFFVTGWWKVFSLGAAEHARTLFVEPYAESWLPGWALWTLAAGGETQGGVRPAIHPGQTAGDETRAAFGRRSNPRGVRPAIHPG